MSVISFGEILWDELPGGMELGGAPLNVVADLRKLGVNARIISGVGNDKLGKDALNALNKIGLSTDHVQVNDHKTGLVKVDLDQNGSPEYQILNDRAWDHIQLTPGMKQAVLESQYLVFGTLIFRNEVSSNTIRSVLSTYVGRCIVDVNFRKPFYSKELVEEILGYADVLKINDEELREISHWKGIQGDYRKMIQTLSELYDLKLVVLTKGEEGAVLYKDEVFYEEKGKNVHVVNTIGAGDAFLAGVIYSLIHDLSPKRTIQIANKMGAFAATSKGAIPDISLKDFEL